MIFVIGRCLSVCLNYISRLGTRTREQVAADGQK